MYKYSLHFLSECKAHLYIRNDSIHEHNTRGLYTKLYTKMHVFLIKFFWGYASHPRSNNIIIFGRNQHF